MSIYDTGAKPINRTAASVFAGGAHHEANIGELEQYDICPPIPENPCPSVAALNKEYRGKRFGRLTVIGWWRSTHNGAQVMCRCDCSRYVPRALKTLKRGNRTMCHSCAYLRDLRQKEYFDRYGRWPDDPKYGE